MWFSPVWVTMIVVVTVGLHLYFMVAGWRKERGLYPPSGWSYRIKELELPLGWSLIIRGLQPLLVGSREFKELYIPLGWRLRIKGFYPENQGVVASF
jgi:hypothetical protein